MHTFLTDNPVTLEIRNASGTVTVELTDTTTTTVDITATGGHPLGFLDDVVKAFTGGRRPESGQQGGFGLFGAGAGPSFGSGGGAEAPQAVDPAEKAVVTYREHDDGGKLMIDTDPARDGWRSSFTVNVTAPTGSNLRVQSQSADLLVSGTANLVEARTAAGNVKLDHTTGTTLVQTASGDIIVRTADGDVDLRTASGDAEVGSVGGNSVVHSTSGDVDLTTISGNLTARTVSGQIRVKDATAGQAEANSVSGDVKIGVHAGSLASVELNTVSGDTSSDFEVQPDLPEGGSPVLHISVRTTSGDIRLTRAS